MAYYWRGLTADEADLDYLRVKNQPREHQKWIRSVRFPPRASAKRALGWFTQWRPKMSNIDLGWTWMRGCVFNAAYVRNHFDSKLSQCYRSEIRQDFGHWRVRSCPWSLFIIVSLNDAYKLYGFKNINVFKFRQLPILWRFPILNYVSIVIAPFVPLRTEIKFLKWSREVMLIGKGTK